MGGEERQRHQPTGRADGSKRRGDGDEPLPAGLYLVATPIGNAADITVRALDVLRRAAVIACEDTRTTAKLLAIHRIRAPLVAYHDHNAANAGPPLVSRLRAGEAVALVSEAGTPLVSDPGYRLVETCIGEGLPVIPVPGPSAVLAALSVAGLPSDRFFFAGFAPPRVPARRRFLEELADVDATLIILESPRRLAEALDDMAEAFGARRAAVCRELTKLFEDVRRDALPALAAHYRDAGAPKGEVTIVIAPPVPAAGLSDGEIDGRLVAALDGGETVRAAVERVARGSGRSRRAVYARALALRPDKPDEESE
ncbi:MAG: 16S rRNA (cytidine(1402)-2'-O)-methyltransferase [Rhodospirillales bacterium]|nr:16S rRNA (cytidine(1402)-2'-O)-methyltransferase [Rhodospirillales bacterium]